MKTVEITEASLAEYGRKTAKETWVLARRGKPVASVVPIRRSLDFETAVEDGAPTASTAPFLVAVSADP